MKIITAWQGVIINIANIKRSCFILLLSVYSCATGLRGDYSNNIAAGISGSNNIEIDRFGVDNSVSKRGKKVMLIASDDAKIYSSYSRGGKSYLSKFLTPFFVTGERDRMVRLSGKSKNYGWARRADLIDIDITRMMKRCDILSVNDTSLLVKPERYFVNADSVWLFSDRSLTKRYAKIPLYKPVYVIKRSENEAAALVSEYAKESGVWRSNQPIGWISEKFLSGVIKDSIKRINVRDSANIVIPWGKKGKISLKDFYKYLDRRLNLIVLLPDLYECADNKIAVIKACREVEKSVSESRNAALSKFKINYIAVYQGDNMLHIVSETDNSINFFNDLCNFVQQSQSPQQSQRSRRRSGNRAISVYDKLSLLGNVLKMNSIYSDEAVGCVVNIGNSASSVVKCNKANILDGYNFRLISCNIGGGDQTNRQNFIFQSSDIIKQYAKRHANLFLNNRLLYMINGGDSLLITSVKLKELNSNIYMLDVPKSSVVEGVVLFPDKNSSLADGDLEFVMNNIFIQIDCYYNRLEHILLNAVRTVCRNERYADEFCKTVKIIKSSLLPESATKFFGMRQLYKIQTDF